MGLIVVVEGPSAAGKTTWIERHWPREVVVDEIRDPEAPDRRRAPRAAARFWAEQNARRWAHALEIEQRHGVAVCDTDPLKLHYVWSLWRAGQSTTAAWHAELAVNRRLVSAGRLGVADLVLVTIPTLGQLRARRDADRSRPRRQFELHLSLVDHLRSWYLALERADPGRVRWRVSIADIDRTAPARDRSEDVLDALLDRLPQPGKPLRPSVY